MGVRGHLRFRARARFFSGRRAAPYESRDGAPAFLSTELDSCERHATGFIFIAMSNASGPTRVAPSSWLLPLGPLAMGLLPRSSPPSCTCFDHLWGDTSPADEMLMAT